MELSHKLRKEIPTRETYFPIDVMANILNRLPSTSISRFQTVSKYWYHVIHVSVIPNPRSNSSLMSVELCTNVDSGKLTVFNFDEEGKTKKSVHKINLECTSHYKFSNMVNGLVCAYGDRSTIAFYLINLTTLKTSKYLKRKIVGTAVDNISLGFDPSTGLYKFIRIYSLFMRDSYYCEILETPDLFQGEWKIMGKTPCDFYPGNPVFLNVAIHWAGIDPFREGEPHAFNFYKFDMKEEKFKRVAPILKDVSDNCGHTVYKAYDNFILRGENGKLYVLHYCCKRQYLDGWKLDESEIHGTVWNVVCRVNFAPLVGHEPRCLMDEYEHPYVVGIADGKVLMRSRYNKRVYIYDLLRRKLSEHRHIDCGSFGRMLFYCVE